MFSVFMGEQRAPERFSLWSLSWTRNWMWISSFYCQFSKQHRSKYLGRESKAPPGSAAHLQQDNVPSLNHKYGQPTARTRFCLAARSSTPWARVVSMRVGQRPTVSSSSYHRPSSEFCGVCPIKTEQIRRYRVIQYNTHPFDNSHHTNRNELLVIVRFDIWLIILSHSHQQWF